MAVNVAKLSEFTGEFGTEPGTGGSRAPGSRAPGAAPECWRCPGPGWCTR